MGFIENVLGLIDKNGITKNKMLKDLGMGTGTFNTWEKRGTIPSGETLSKIAAYFNVSIDYLLGNEQKNKPTVPTNNELNDLYDLLNHENKQKILELARLYLAGQDKK